MSGIRPMNGEDDTLSKVKVETAKVGITLSKVKVGTKRSKRARIVD